MNYFIFDNPADEQSMKFLNEYEINIEQLYPNKQCLSIRNMIEFCNHCISISKYDDTLICWYDFMGIITWWLCRFKFKKRKIIILNILLKEKKSIKNKIAHILYRLVLNSNNVKATVTSKEYGAVIKKKLRITKNFTILHDIYHINYKLYKNIEMEENSIFCGGRNGRDWKFIMELSKLMEDVKFNLVMPKNEYEKYSNQFGNNVNARYDIPFDEYIKELLKSTIVAIPLDTEAPAGLIVFFQAAANNKMIISSDTTTTREYLSQDKGALLNDSLDNWKNTIYFYLNNELKRRECSVRLYDFLSKECSESNYVKVLNELLKKEK